MLAQFFKSSSVYFLLTIISRGSNILLLPVYTSALTPEAFGVLDVMIILGSIINLTIALEVTQGIGRFMNSTDEHSSVYISTGFWFTVTTYFIFCLSFYIAIPLIMQISSFSQFSLQTLNLYILYLLLFGLFNFIRSTLRWQLNLTAISVADFLYVGVMIISTVYFTVHKPLGIDGVMLGLVLGNGTATLIGIFSIYREIIIMPNLKYLRTLIIFSAPLVLSSVMVWLSLYIDRVMISRIIGIDFTGLYSAGVRFSNLGPLALGALAASITPLIYKNLDTDKLTENLKLIFCFFNLISFIILLTYLTFGKVAFEYMTTNQFHSAQSVLLILVPGLLLNKYIVFAPGIGIKKKTFMIFRINTIAAIINIILNLLLIDRFGINGAAYSTIASLFVAFALHLFFSEKLYPINDIRFCGKMIFMSLLIVYGGFVVFFEKINAELFFQLTYYSTAFLLLCLLHKEMFMTFYAALFSKEVR